MTHGALRLSPKALAHFVTAGDGASIIQNRSGFRTHSFGRGRHTVQRHDEMSALAFTVIVSGLEWWQVAKWFTNIAMESDMSYDVVEDLAIGAFLFLRN